MKTLTLANQKGGVGKSAVARLLAHYLVRLGKRVLAIDLDHQANFSKPLKLSGRAVVAPFSSAAIIAGSVPELPAGELVLVESDPIQLLNLESQKEKHNDFAMNFRAFLRAQIGKFDVCIIDTNPNPDIRVVCALVSSNYVLSPIQLNQEAIDGIVGLVNHPRVGIARLKSPKLNPTLELIGLLPTLVEPVPFQRRNMEALAKNYSHLLIPLDGNPMDHAGIGKRSVIAEAQATGEILWEIKKTSARDVWKELEPTLRTIVKRMGVEGV